ncbi:SDR family NAD(P)-dependent oxidoreductase [Klebsiella grimontii]
MARFSAKRVLITGATSGIGLAGAQRIDREGGWVIATGRDPRRLALLRRQLSDRARVIDNDASDPLTGAALAKEIHASGGLDGLWLNAGYAAVGELSQIDAAAFDHMMATNVRGPVLQMAALAGKLNPGASVVNPQGNRFFNEMETRDKVSAAIIALPEHFAYIVFDEHVRAKNKAADEYIAKGFVTSASSPRQLAEKLGMDYHAFLNTLERYNGFVEKQHDDDFGRTTALRAPINEGPYHAIRIAPGVHHTMGGVTVNTDTAVLNAGHQVIAGAFAAGEVVGGIHGGNRIGGNAVADIIIFGTLAGHQAAKRARS